MPPGPTLAFVVGKLGCVGRSGAPGKSIPPGPTLEFVIASEIDGSKSGLTALAMSKHSLGLTHVSGFSRNITVPFLHSQPSPAHVAGQARALKSKQLRGHGDLQFE